MGPFRVLHRHEKFFVVDYGGRPEHVSVDRVKPAHTDSSDVPLSSVPRRGRPKKS